MSTSRLARVRIRPRRWARTTLTALALALALVTCADYTAFAATGHSFVLGKLNKANQVTTLKRTTAGPVLTLATTSSSASPLTVNGRGLVANLNADNLDGLDASAFARAGSGRQTAYLVEKSVDSPTSLVGFTLEVPDGAYQISYSAGLLGSPAGKQLRCAVSLTSGWTVVKYAAYVATTTSGSGFDGVSAAGVLTKGSGTKLVFSCTEGAGSFTTSADIPIQVVLRPLDVVTTVAPG